MIQQIIQMNVRFELHSHLCPMTNYIVVEQKLFEYNNDHTSSRILLGLSNH